MQNLLNQNIAESSLINLLDMENSIDCQKSDQPGLGISIESVRLRE